MEAFTVITGLAGLLGLVLQLSDAFPEHRETRKAVVYLIIGVFVGSLVTGVLRASVSVSGPLSGYALLLLGLGSVIFFCIVVAAFASEAAKREAFFGASGIGTGVFLLVALFGSAISPDMERISLSKSLSLDEYLELADRHAAKGNFDRAIELLDRARSAILRSDPRYEAIGKRTADLKEKQTAVSK